MMLRTIVALAYVGSALWPARADACSCARAGSPCEGVGQADSVFVGRVVSVESSGLGGTVDLAVVEPFRGGLNWQVRIDNGPGNCAYSFTAGESYLVYTHKTPDGRMGTSMCTRTRPVADAAEDLSYLRALAAISPNTPARVTGRVQLMDRFRTTNDQVRPMPGVAISAIGQGRTFSATADDRGEFTLTGLRLGAYDLTTKAPQGYESPPVKIEIHDPRGCREIRLVVWYDGRVNGRLIDRNGRPIGHLPIELVPVGDITARAGEGFFNKARSNDDGTFEMRRVGPGDYVLAVAGTAAPQFGVTARAFSSGAGDPTRAVTVTVGAGEQVGLQNLALPNGLKLVTITGAVIDEKQQPVRDAAVSIGGRETERGGYVRLPLAPDSQGRFTLTVMEGTRYVVYATRRAGPGPPQTGRTEFTASSASPAVTVMVQPPRF